MAVLSETDRNNAYLDYMRANRDTIAVTKAQLRAAIDATDDWVDANAASFNNALPTAAKNNLTPKQKALLVSYVTLKRFGVF